jgi:hypothetical protein
MIMSEETWSFLSKILRNLVVVRTELAVGSRDVTRLQNNRALKGVAHSVPVFGTVQLGMQILL